MNIVQVSTADRGGGAYQVAWFLYEGYAQAGHTSWMVVHENKSGESRIVAMSSYRDGLWYRLLNQAAQVVPNRLGLWRIQRGLKHLARPKWLLSQLQGHEFFDFPDTHRVWGRLPVSPDIIHAHNLHGNYFDLRVLPTLSHRYRTVLTLHDAWLLSGHCAHSFECERWRIGCGQCPDLLIPHPLWRDGTAYNWQRKRSIYSHSRLYVATPCQWLMDKVHASILSEGIADSRVIPHGIDLSIFPPKPKFEVRKALGLPQETQIILFAANGIRKNVWKDYTLMRGAIRLLGEMDTPILFLALGEDAPSEQIGNARIQFVPFQEDVTRVAQYYQAADVYLHGARVETFPNTILEALACGVPVVATAVGGIPEQIQGYGGFGVSPTLNKDSVDAATGILVPPGDAHSMAQALEKLLENKDIRQRLGHNATDDAKQRFDLKLQVERYLAWFEEIQSTS
jgi:glycosyltransferase involved in cell wall biosynthesis